MTKSCKLCGTTETCRWQAGYCNACYQRINYQKTKDGEKNREQSPCVVCGTTENGKRSHGMCKKCYLHWYYVQHREYLISQADKWRKNNPEKYKAARHIIDKRVSKTPRGKLRIKKHGMRRRAALHNVENTLTIEEWKRICETYHHRCAYCGRKARLEMDHIIPLSKKGPNIMHNIVPSCRNCNSKKHDGPVLSPIQPVLL